jgi:hypothetical protein
MSSAGVRKGAAEEVAGGDQGGTGARCVAGFARGRVVECVRLRRLISAHPFT